MSYTVTAAVVVLRLEDGGRVYVYRDGVLPSSAEKEHVDQLLADKMIEKTKAPKADAGSDAGKEPTIKEILADVGEDKAKASAALEAEQAKGEKARSSLVEQLQAIVSAS
jgi:hypothetical protein